jgi:AcrR family transcriptional regulator
MVSRSRRERLRAATVDEIHATARRLLVDDGAAAVTLRAISREMGMTAPALYRYYDSLDSLLEGLCVVLYDECTAYIESAVSALPDDDLGGRLTTAARAFRQWSVDHPAEFTTMFARRVDIDPDQYLISRYHEACMRIANAFFTLFIALWHRSPFPVPADADLDPALRGEFAAFAAETGGNVPAGAVQVFISCWIRLYGIVALEVFGHLRFAMSDGAPMFEAELADFARDLNLPWPTPAQRPADAP